MKTYEACLYNPSGTIRELKPITNADLQELSIPFLNSTTSKAIVKGNTEIFADELMTAHSKDDFFIADTLYRVLILAGDNLFSRISSELSHDGFGWEKIRNNALNRIMQYDSTVKLWSAVRRRHPLHQPLPHTLLYGNDTEHYFRLRRLNIPTDVKTARRDFKSLMKTGTKQAIKPEAGNFVDNWDFSLKLRRRLIKALLTASHVIPKTAVDARTLDILVRHSLKTELMMDLDKNINSMGMINNREDFKFSDVIRKFQEPTEKHLPLTFTTTYKTSMYAMTSKYISPAKMWDSEPIQGITM